MQNNVRTDVPFSPSLLKSAIQKAVRRGEVDKALACTKSLIDKDPRALLRRILIICLEDGLLHPSYAELAVLTDHIRLKGSGLTEQDKTFVMTVVADLAKSQYRDFDKHCPDYVESYKIAKMEDNELGLVNSINYRVKIGGYKGDLDLLRNYARIWAKRFGDNTWNVERIRSYFSGEIIEYADIGYATAEDIPLETIDFHNSPVSKILIKKPHVVQMIQQAMPKGTRDWAKPWTDDIDLLNKIIWSMRSGMNFKKVVWSGKPVDWLVEDEIPKELWDDFRTIYGKIEGELDNLAKWFLDKVS